MKQRRITTDWETLESLDPWGRLEGQQAGVYAFRPLKRRSKYHTDIIYKGIFKPLDLRYSRRLRSLFKAIRKQQEGRG